MVIREQDTPAMGDANRIRIEASMPPSVGLKKAGRRALSTCACTIAENYLDEIQEHRQATGLPVAWRGLLKELRSRCPGFTDIQYGIALNRAFIRSHDPTPYEHGPFS